MTDINRRSMVRSTASPVWLPASGSIVRYSDPQSSALNAVEDERTAATSGIGQL